MNSLKRITVLGVMLVMLSVTVSPASANAALSQQTKNSLNNILSGLSANDIVELISYIATYALQNRPASTTGTASSAQLCSSAQALTKDLRYGMNDAQVTSLQRVLNIAASGTSTFFRFANLTSVGTSGNETTYFGPATRDAVIRWQTAYLGSTRATGVVDATTRTKMVAVYCNGAGPNTATQGSNTTTTQTSTGSSSTSSSSSTTGGSSNVPGQQLVLTLSNTGNIAVGQEVVLTFTGQVVGQSCTLLPYSPYSQYNGPTGTPLSYSYGAYYETTYSKQIPGGIEYGIKFTDRVGLRMDCSDGSTSNMVYANVDK